MAITFYAGSGSPWSWRVWLTLEHKQIPYQLQMLSFSGGDLKKPEYLAINPRGKVPAIVDGDLQLYESAAIARYLEEAYPQKPLYPSAPRERALVHRLIAEIDNYIGTANGKLVDEVLFKPEAERNQAAIDRARQELAAELGRIEAQLGGDFLAGPLTAADFALYPLLALGLRIEAKRAPQLGYAAALGPRTRAWKARIEALPYYDKTYPPHWRQ